LEANLIQTGPAPSGLHTATVRFATLGPAGTNHELITKRYLAAQGVSDYEIRLVLSFRDAVTMLKAGEVDYILQCAVHPEMPQTLGENFRTVFAIDCFISPSQELAVLTRAEVEHPERIGLLMPANEKYTDLSRWKTKVPYPSLPLIVDGMLAGKVDSGLVYRSFADRYPGRFRIDEVIGSPDDVWVVYGRNRAYEGKLLGTADQAFLKDLRKRHAEGMKP
jgi:hypothetical protein